MSAASSSERERERERLTTTWTGPLPCTSHAMSNGPPRASATARRPLRVGSRSHTASSYAGCLSTSATGVSSSLARRQSAGEHV